MKKWYLGFILLLAVGVLAACGSDDTSSSNGSKPKDTKEIKIGATAGPYSDMVKKAIVPGLEEKGYKVEIVEFSDYVQPNKALANGDIDANLFQHKIYLENFAKENKLDITDLTSVPTAPMGIYSKKFDSIDKIADGATIAFPNDPTNAARAFTTLQDQGILKIDDKADTLTVSEKDIVENPKNLKFQPVEAGQLPRLIDSVDLVAVPGNFALAANFDLLSALALEDMKDSFRNYVAIKTADQEAQFAKDIKAVIESKDFEAIIDEEFKGFGKPTWMENR